MQPADASSPAGATGAGRRLGLALVSAAVLLLQLAHARVLTLMVWHHVAYVVVTLTLLGFAAGGALLACRPAWLAGGVSGRLRGASLLFGLATLVAYALVTRVRPGADTGTAALLLSTLQDAVLVVPMVAGGLVVALCLADAGEATGRLYAWNLGGSALGCLLFVPVLRGLGGEGAVQFAAALAFVGAACFERGRAAGPALLAAATLAVAALAPTSLFEVPLAESKAMAHHLKEDPLRRVERTAWDPVCRLDLVGRGPEHPDDDRYLFQDGGAPTVLPLGVGETDLFSEPGLGYLLFDGSAPRVLAVGIGGGVDILQATRRPAWPDGSQPRFTGVELNPTTVALMRGPLAELTGNRYELPGVDVHVGEGRAWLEATDERYDLIQLSGTDTYTALASGSMVLSESYLYTAEAFDAYLEHLTPRGALCMVRFRFDPPRECLRLVVLAVEALRRAGVERPQDHIMMLGSEGRQVTTDDGRTYGVGYGVLLVTREPVAPHHVDRFQELTSLPRYELLAAPGVDTGTPFADYLAAAAAGTDGALRAASALTLEEPTDDRPFFFRFHRWADALDGLWGADPEPASWYLDQIGEAPVAMRMLLFLALEVTLLVVLLVLGPLLVVRRAGLSVTGAGRWMLLFGGVGLGYMLVEVAAMQRLVLLLGHPTRAIVVVLVVFLLGSALGASLAGRSDDPRRTLRRSLLVVVVLLAALGWFGPTLVAGALGASFVGRIALVVALLGPLAVAMGMPFASALRLVRRSGPAFVPWACGVNGAASVAGSVGALFLALEVGFAGVFLAAGAAYLLATAAALASPRAPGDAGDSMRA